MANLKGMDGIELQSKIQLDYNKGLYWQLLNANLQWGEYMQFINEPKHLVNPYRDIILFDNWFLEMFTRTPWYFIPIAYIYTIWYHLNLSPMTWDMTLLFVFVGLFQWTFLEYFLHRWFFHGEESWLPN